MTKWAGTDSDCMEFKGNFVRGKWQEALSGKTLRNISPSDTSDILHEFPDSSPEDVKQAIDAASAAQKDWADTPGQKRGTFLRTASEIMAANQEYAAKLISREMGKSIREARLEIGRSVDLLQYYAGWGWRQSGTLYSSGERNSSLYTIRVPLGVVSLITPWNFPSAIPVWKSAPALVSGNTVVLKPSCLAPASSLFIAECLEKAGLPAGVFNVVCGHGSELSEALVTDERIKAVSFTGSCSTGAQLFKAAASPARRTGLEMGGKNPILVMPDAELDTAVELAVAGAMQSAGQKCTATSRAIVHRDVARNFTEKLVERVRRLKVGDPLDETQDIGPVVDRSQMEAILSWIETGLAEGARLLVGGKRLHGQVYDRGFYLQPAVFGSVSPDMKIAREEIFGPVLAVMEADGFDEMMRIANNTAYGLSASICTKDMSLAEKFIRGIEAGLVHVNSMTTGAQPHVPFGGMKGSSSGFREMGETAIDFYTTYKTVYYSYG